ncbi:RNA polymerase sigma factor SigJ [Rathayibacter sp. KR2-224]|uniref:RNA polymerase sigma factor SigJ n=1 Tax=Rathayibacter sp. KR2-224 TaxID=3400913 RepID=UPI003C018B61
MTADRRLLMSIAYRLLGSTSEAEDAVQEAFARWYAMPVADRDEITSPVGWLVTVTTRICLDVLGSARARRERYVGEWIPEPLPSGLAWTSRTRSDREDDPLDRVSLDESLNMAMLVVLESMTPAERVSFILHDVFAYSFAEVGEMVGRTPQACRQLASAARRRIGTARRDRVSTAEHARVVAAFQAAVEGGDVGALIQLLDPNATAIADGGGIVRAAIKPIVGAQAIADYLVNLRRMVPDLHFELTTVNGRTGMAGVDAAGKTVTVAAIAVADGLVQNLWVVRNPHKLTYWS